MLPLLQVSTLDVKMHSTYRGNEVFSACVERMPVIVTFLCGSFFSPLLPHSRTDLRVDVQLPDEQGLKSGVRGRQQCYKCHRVA